MAIIWQKKTKDRRYEVRSAGRTRRLYTNGVCHSQYHPQKLLTGSIWDLLLLPAFFLKTPPRRVLILGVGGGAVLRLIRAFFQPELILGVELDATHLYVAERFFGIKDDTIHLVHAEAEAWLQAYDGHTFDMVIEDLFTDQKGLPVRAITARQTWCESLFANLDKEGVLVMNFASEAEYRIAHGNRAPGLAGCRSRFKLTSPKLDNVVGVYAKQPVSSETLHQGVSSQPLIEQALQSRYLQFRLRKCEDLHPR